MRIPMIIEGNMGNIERQKKEEIAHFSHLLKQFPTLSKYSSKVQVTEWKSIFVNTFQALDNHS